jgi:hypothetical protein
LGDEVIVVEHSLGGIPEIFVDGLSSCCGAIFPLFCFGVASEERGEVGHIKFIFIEEAVEADGSVVAGGTTEWAKAKAGVEG